METERPLPIGEVERRTGLGKDTLRVWERRYGFPAPLRANDSSRTYPAEQVEKLVLIRTLLDRGHRPAALVSQPVPALRKLLAAGDPSKAAADPVAAFFDDLARGEVGRLRRWLAEGLRRHGLEKFVLDIAAPSAFAIGEAWAAGRLPIYAEHLFTEQLSRVLRTAIAELPAAAADAAPRVLLATLPGEPHVLGLLMAEAVMALEGAACLTLGAETPPSQILAAAAAYGTDVVALSVSAASSGRAVRRDIDLLLASVGAAVEIWIGGAGSAALRQDRTRLINSLAAAPLVIRAWRERHQVGLPTP